MYRSSEVFNGRPVVSVFEKIEPQSPTMIAPLMRIFNSRSVVSAVEKSKLQDLTAIAPLMRIEQGAGQNFETCFNQFKNSYDMSTMDTLVIGNWLKKYDAFSRARATEILSLLIKKKADLSALRALFVGDIASEESEISWIAMADLTPFLMQFPELHYFRARAAGSFLETPLVHKNLKKLAFETGGLSANTLMQLIESELPNLESLELWIGNSEYGDVEIDDIKALIDVLPTRYPKLRYLGLRNAELADEIAVIVADAPILQQIDTLDLSLGALTDKGAAALLRSTQLTSIKRLDLHYHFIESEDLLRQLQEKLPHVDVAGQQEVDVYDDEVYRYIFVAE